MQWVTARAVRRAGASSCQIHTAPTRKGGWRGLPHGGLAGKGYARRYAPLAYARTNGAFHVQPAMAVTRSAPKSSAKSKSKPPSAGRRSGPTAQERLVQGLIELMQQGEAGDPEGAARSWVSYRQVPVSNASDLEGPGLAELIAARQEAAGLQARPEPERPAAAEAVLSAWPVPVSIGGDRAFYLPLLDRIQLPERAGFDSPLLAQMRNVAAIENCNRGIDAMARDEAAYWLGMAMHRKNPLRELAALRLLLSAS